jgi:hypothetical protein
VEPTVNILVRVIHGITLLVGNTIGSLLEERFWEEVDWVKAHLEEGGLEEVDSLVLVLLAVLGFGRMRITLVVVAVLIVGVERRHGPWWYARRHSAW